MSLPKSDCVEDVSMSDVSAVDQKDQALFNDFKMPPAIITKIFMLALPPIPEADGDYTSEPDIGSFERQRCIFRAVCKKWREFIDGTSSLRRVIAVDRTTVSSLESQLKRSQLDLIDVFVVIFGSRVLHRIIYVLGRIQPHLDRVRVLSLLFDNKAIAAKNVSSFVQSTFPFDVLTDLPSLEVLKLNLGAEHVPPPSFGKLHAPKLRHYQHTRFLTKGLTAETGKDLTTFQFSAVEGDLEPWKLLARSKHVTKLEVIIDVVPSLDEVILLTKLHTLDIVFRKPHYYANSTAILGKIRAPSVYQISVHNSSTTDLDVPSLIQLFHGDLSNVVMLSISGATFDHDEIGSLLQLWNKVTELTLISSWINAALTDGLSYITPKDELKYPQLQKIILEYCEWPLDNLSDLCRRLEGLGVHNWLVEDHDGEKWVGGRQCGKAKLPMVLENVSLG
ncbi:hypothetical protein BU17DRAFT_96379 [Hysterangium stoloniferum]|nr:hypothetical protein BU17DRAFT_96379 [Hysterangium stoloniferum]